MEIPDKSTHRVTAANGRVIRSRRVERRMKIAAIAITSTVTAIYLIVEALVRQIRRKSATIKTRAGQFFFSGGAAEEAAEGRGGAAGVTGVGTGGAGGVCRSCTGGVCWLCAMRFRRGCFFAISMTSRSM